MKSKLVVLGKITVFCFGVYFSLQHWTDSWSVGPIFGVVVLTWYARLPTDLLSLKAAAFLAASTLTYALVVKKYEPAILYKTDNLLWVVALGTVLLALAHAVFLKASWKRMLIAIPCIYATWWLSMIVVDRLRLTGSLAEIILNPISSWQGGYLLFMFAPQPWWDAQSKPPPPEPPSST